MERNINIEFTIIIDLFTFCLKKKEYKYLIHNNNGFIHPPPARREYKYSIHNNNRFIYLLLEKEGV